MTLHQLFSCLPSHDQHKDELKDDPNIFCPDANWQEAALENDDILKVNISKSI